ncbi:MAG: hypothetical protein ACTSQ8_08020 [Candidatus Helarchaeota archaeon]
MRCEFCEKLMRGDHISYEFCDIACLNDWLVEHRMPDSEIEKLLDEWRHV